MIVIVTGPESTLVKIDLSSQIVTCIEIECHGASVVRIRPDLKLVAIGGWDSHVYLYSLKSLKLLAQLVYHRDTITDIQFDPENTSTFISSARDKKICMWNAY
jgi:WD40 repeat protein